MYKLNATTIEKLMRQCDSLGRSEFLKLHNYGHPTQYWVLSNTHPDREPYPAKAIAGVSLGLPNTDFNGGYSHSNSACNLLERANFVIVSRTSEPITRRVATAQIEKRYKDKIKSLGETEVQRLGKQRIGQDIFRAELLKYWDGRCQITGMGQKELLRASHIKSWAKCDSDAERLDPENGLLLSALWDCAFDIGLISFSDQGSVLFSRKLSKQAKIALGGETKHRLELTKGHKNYLDWHRKNVFKG